MSKYEVFLTISGLLIMSITVYGQWEFFKFVMVTFLNVGIDVVESFKPFFIIGGLAILTMSLFLNAFTMWFITAFYSDIEFLKLLIISMNGFLGVALITIVLLVYPGLIISVELSSITGVIGDVISVITMYFLLRAFGAIRKEAIAASVASWLITNLVFYGMTALTLHMV